MAVYYRFVSDEEARDFSDSGELRLGRNSMEGKNLTDTPEHAAQWRNVIHQRYGGVGGRIMRVELEDEVELFHLGDNIDGIGPAWFATMEQLAGAKVELLDE